MNIVAIVGNVATAPELRHTPTGRAVCTFRVAVSRRGAEEADFFSVVTWERQAEVCAEYLDIGRRVGLEGRLHHSTWKNDAGESRSRVEIVAHRVNLLGARKGASGEGEGEISAHANGPGEVPDVVAAAS